MSDDYVYDALTLIERDDPQWRQHAKCRSSNPSLFILERGEDYKSAIQVCNSCPVKDPCLRFALDNDEVGIWGGTSHKQRRRMKRVAKSSSEVVA